MHPCRDAWQRRDSFFSYQLTIQLFLGVTDSLDALGSSRGAQPSWKDGVIALTERRQKLFASDRDALVRHGFLPGKPVEFFRINQRSVHVPQHGTRHTHPNTSFIVYRVAILNCATAALPNFFRNLRQSILLQMACVGVEFSDAL